MSILSRWFGSSTEYEEVSVTKERTETRTYSTYDYEITLTDGRTEHLTDVRKKHADGGVKFCTLDPYIYGYVPFGESEVTSRMNLNRDYKWFYANANIVEVEKVSSNTHDIEDTFEYETTEKQEVDQ